MCANFKYFVDEVRPTRVFEAKCWDMAKRVASVLQYLLDKHENTSKENPRNREPGCSHLYDRILNVIEYD
jgi:hypothetical protein